MIKCLISILVIWFIFPSSLYSEEVIKSVRYLKPDSSFSEVIDLYINNGVISRIIPSKQKDSIRYVIPSFCDVYTTLGADSTGGQNNLEGIKTALRSFLYHGFTHIVSVADGPWIYKIKSEVDSGKILGPKITIASKPILSKSAETKDIPEELYFLSDSKKSTLSELNKQLNNENQTVHILNRYSEDSSFSFDSGILNQIRLEAKDKNKFLTVHTFADRISILDVLISGNRHLIHPIPYQMQKELTPEHIKEMNLVPILNVYKNFYLTNKEGSDGISELENLRSKNKFFVDHYVSFYESTLGVEIEEQTVEVRKNDYLSYLEFIEKNPILKRKMILGSGSGNRLSFPGISGIQELQILGKILKLDESFFRIPNQNSCSYIGGSYKGILEVGKEANLLVLKDNPTKNLDTLYAIEQVFQSGKFIRWNQEKKKKK